MTDAADYLSTRVPARPNAALILGSGIGGLADEIDDAIRVPFADIPGFPPTSVEGHAGRVVAGRLAGVPVVAFQGRYHAYEGHPTDVLERPALTAAALGASALIVTGAAGGIDADIVPGTILILEDQIDATRGLEGLPRAEGDPAEPPFDPELSDRAESVASEENVAVARGVYAGVLGPSYETPAEIRMLATLGADAVGMSVIHDARAGNEAGMRVLGLALVTNHAPGVGEAPLDHADVIAAGDVAAERFGRLVRGVVRRSA